MNSKTTLFTKIAIIVIIFFLNFLTAQIPDANGIIYVTENGTGNGSSWGSATGNLHDAIHSTNVQKVFVATGNYNVGDHSFVMKNGVEIYGGFEPVNGITTLAHNRILPNKGMGDGSVLNGQNARPVIWNDDNGLNNSAILDGFTITGGNGGGIYNKRVSPTFNNLVISNNSTGNNGGGGMDNFISSPVITNVVFLNNTANYGVGGAISNSYSTVTITNAVFKGNQTIGTSGTVIYNSTNSSATLTNVLIAENSGPLAAIVQGENGNITFNNVSITNNNTAGTLLIFENGSATINNSIVFGAVDALNGGVYTTQYSFIQGNTNTSNGNINTTGITANDIFANDYSLKPASFVLNKGNNALFPSLDANTKDLAGNPRLVGAAIDLGAYEYPYSIFPNTNGIIYVRQTALGAKNGSSWDDATNDLHNAIQATNVQKVFVATGNYNVGDHSFIMKNGVEIYGGFDPTNNIKTLSDDRIMPNNSNTRGSVLNGQGVRPVIWNVFTSATKLENTAVLDGFAVFNGAYSDGGGIRNVYASPTFKNLYINANVATSSGAGVFNDNSNPLISNTVISSNIIININSNISGAGILNTNTSAPVITNTTITDNKLITTTGTINGAGIYNTGLSEPKVYNSIIWNNLKNNNPIISGADIENGGGNITLKNSITQSYTTGNTADNNQVGTNPMFISSSDFRLQNGSPAVNTGSNILFAGLDANTKDLAGNTRVYNYTNGGYIDLGAYESSYNSPLSADNNGIIYVKTAVFGNGSGKSWDNATADLQGAINATDVQKVFVANGNYNAPVTSFVMKNNVAIYGSFDPDNNIKTLSDTRVYPSLAVNGSVLNGQNTHRVIHNNFTEILPLNTTAILDGFTITNGNSTFGSGMYNIYASPTLRNLVIKNNTATASGGGIATEYASPTLTNVIISGNNATNPSGSARGGGMYNYSANVVVTNMIISNNTASAMGANSFGGGIYTINSTAQKFTNVNLTNNTATASSGYSGVGGAIFNNASDVSVINATIANNSSNSGSINSQSASASVTLYNSILWGNQKNGSATASGADIEGPGTKTVKNTITQVYNSGNITDNNQVGVNPMFISASNFILQSISPAINVGDNSLFPNLDANTKDLAGNARVFGSIIDLGAYEFQGTLVVNSVSENKIQTYPNPTDGIIFIKTGKEEKVNLYNIIGQFIKTVSLQSGINRIDITTLPTGLYILKTMNESFKIMKK